MKEVSLKRPDGMSLWKWWALRLILSRSELHVISDSKPLKTLLALQKELGDSRKWNAEWRERCISAERAMSYEISQAHKAIVQKHDAKFDTTRSWRI